MYTALELYNEKNIKYETSELYGIYKTWLHCTNLQSTYHKTQVEIKQIHRDLMGIGIVLMLVAGTSVPA